MSVDSALLGRCESGEVSPILRLYGWREPSVTIGYSQKADRELDLDRCREAGIPVVRRPSGGRALLHHREVTYSVAAPVSHPRFQKGLKNTFSAISEALLAGLAVLGIEGAQGTPEPGGRRTRETRSPACFASLNHCEITVGGQKLIGSAQKRTARAFLQHGSVMIDSDPDLLLSLLRFENDRQRTLTRRRLEESATDLNRVCSREVTFEEVRAAVLQGFQQTFPGIWTPEPPPLREDLSHSLYSSLTGAGHDVLS
ncbi:MAG: hypothetical protein GWM98_08960 [Nitrospinaceae bacterium]|nr:lipoate--protein ligase family protein [Nitrospinaceae bacterium]NIR54592.1 lipoate--protein ligase family protein [Nitrospinaceae bacterium]NIS85014.1 lipoate--protein ligase family protein [Nitrospinaceae bacterium]NIT81825.1 lipoate--protein ligase family protein [Nitrospinaceae bacterium]NIU44088.1 lipoate--protein ligase family protein [Nitrospinaceae bacterium]